MAARAFNDRPGIHSSLIESARRKGKNVRQLRQDAEQVFSKFDADSSGCLSEREIKQVIKQLTGKVATAEQVYFLKKELDADGNNIITREEFVLWYVILSQLLACPEKMICNIVSRWTDVRILWRSQVVCAQVHQVCRR